MRLINYIINDIAPIDESKNMGDVQTIFSQTTYSHAPISKADTFVGCLPENDVHCYDAHEPIANCTHNYTHFFVRMDTTWLDALQAFAQHSCNVMPVLDDQNQYVG